MTRNTALSMSEDVFPATISDSTKITRLAHVFDMSSSLGLPLVAALFLRTIDGETFQEMCFFCEFQSDSLTSWLLSSIWMRWILADLSPEVTLDDTIPFSLHARRCLIVDSLDSATRSLDSTAEILRQIESELHSSHLQYEIVDGNGIIESDLEEALISPFLSTLGFCGSIAFETELSISSMIVIIQPGSSISPIRSFCQKHKIKLAVFEVSPDTSSPSLHQEMASIRTERDKTALMQSMVPISILPFVNRFFPAFLPTLYPPHSISQHKIAPPQFGTSQNHFATTSFTFPVEQLSSQSHPSFPTPIAIVPVTTSPKNHQPLFLKPNENEDTVSVEAIAWIESDVELRFSVSDSLSLWMTEDSSVLDQTVTLNRLWLHWITGNVGEWKEYSLAPQSLKGLSLSPDIEPEDGTALMFGGTTMTVGGYEFDSLPILPFPIKKGKFTRYVPPASPSTECPPQHEARKSHPSQPRPSSVDQSTSANPPPPPTPDYTQVIPDILWKGREGQVADENDSLIVFEIHSTITPTASSAFVGLFLRSRCENRVSLDSVIPSSLENESGKECNAIVHTKGRLLQKSIFVSDFHPFPHLHQTPLAQNAGLFGIVDSDSTNQGLHGTLDDTQINDSVDFAFKLGKWLNAITTDYSQAPSMSSWNSAELDGDEKQVGWLNPSLTHSHKYALPLALSLHLSHDDEEMFTGEHSLQPFSSTLPVRSSLFTKINPLNPFANPHLIPFFSQVFSSPEQTPLHAGQHQGLAGSYPQSMMKDQQKRIALQSSSSANTLSKLQHEYKVHPSRYSSTHGSPLPPQSNVGGYTTPTYRSAAFQKAFGQTNSPEPATLPSTPGKPGPQQQEHLQKLLKRQTEILERTNQKPDPPPPKSEHDSRRTQYQIERQALLDKALADEEEIDKKLPSAQKPTGTRSDTDHPPQIPDWRESLLSTSRIASSEYFDQFISFKR